MYAPQVSVPSKREFGETEEILVHCNVTANPPAHAIVWTKEGDPAFRQVVNDALTISIRPSISLILPSWDVESKV